MFYMKFMLTLMMLSVLPASYLLEASIGSLKTFFFSNENFLGNYSLIPCIKGRIIFDRHPLDMLSERNNYLHKQGGI